MLTYILFVIGFALLIKGADFLVEGSSSIAKKFNIPSIVIGLTIVAFGTSAPELIVNLFAVTQGNTEIAIGNILGSNIVNILFILGISTVIYPLTAKADSVIKEIPFSMLAAVVVGLMANDVLIDKSPQSVLSLIDGLVLLGFFAIFMYYTVGISKKQSDSEIVEARDEIKVLGNAKSALYVLGGLVALTVGGKWIVDGAVAIATNFGLSQSLIGLTVVAVGTSLPELATSAIAAYKKQSDIAIGNVVGSNIFNIFFILGISSVIKPLPFSLASNFDIYMTMFATALLFILMYVGKKHTIQKWQGILMILCYVAYTIYLVYTR
jgi:cation:H+ antiporter